MILVGTERSGTGEFRKTLVLPLRHQTTKRHPSSPDNSGFVRTLRLLLAALSAAPSLVAAPALAIPSLLMALTRAASMASCAPPGPFPECERTVIAKMSGFTILNFVFFRVLPTRIFVNFGPPSQRCPVLPHVEFWPFLGPLPGHPFDLPKCH